MVGRNIEVLGPFDFQTNNYPEEIRMKNRSRRRLVRETVDGAQKPMIMSVKRRRQNADRSSQEIPTTSSVIDEAVILSTTGFIESNLIGALENCEGKVSTSVADLVNRELHA